MSGHSKWHNIRIKKQKMDQVRGKLFSRLSREITVAAKEGGGNPEGNPRLRTAIERAREAGMPNENIQRAIQRGTGEGSGAALERVTYEGYAPGGVAVLVEAVTDNRNRTASEVRALFTRHGGRFGEAGSVAWMFEQKGELQVDRHAVTEDDLMLVALEAGAEDVRTSDETYEVITAPEDFLRVKQALQARGIPLVSADVTMLPRSTVRVEGKEARQLLQLMEALEDHEDVQRAYANFDIPEEILQQAG
ncbi:MAG: YebC/PmpR family DNA-binding transcriptional regulator [Armatimonadota bacterium]|nr:YebC/PmpR family DNA-binding transcriptional regulator [Armatimonadota bacterium]MDR7427269.1 YebC/PmpR family DNA-binding transcriptional regulator [Armatimonadota bacterium]MDR7463157.1 YebC/PmpR family DNA-binding transcriptional regulator [Armatimonadota bacterium]MDR7468856.1 YebC/PmpR family DNA-binding transcriptional regulator [Armatimonadota bacterium]MDR7475402.1 YebC/PmpR family DNA-binding transcriptional regulator [Armatimonadota bacterium]